MKKPTGYQVFDAFARTVLTVALIAVIGILGWLFIESPDWLKLLMLGFLVMWGSIIVWEVKTGKNVESPEPDNSIDAR